jgi:hypothetical protein
MRVREEYVEFEKNLQDFDVKNWAIYMYTFGYIGGSMSKQNNEKNNQTTTVLLIMLGLFLPMFLPALLMIALGKWMPEEITYSGILSLLLLSLELFIVALIFTKILSLFGLSEKKLDELGFLGFTISAVTSFLATFVGYFWMSNLKWTSVQISPYGILAIAIVSTIILSILLKVMERLDDSSEQDTNK